MQDPLHWEHLSDMFIYWAPTMCLGIVQAARDTAVSYTDQKVKWLMWKGIRFMKRSNAGCYHWARKAPTRQDRLLHTPQTSFPPSEIEIESLQSLRIFKTVNLKNFTSNFQLLQTGKWVILATDNVFKVFLFLQRKKVLKKK